MLNIATSKCRLILKTAAFVIAALLLSPPTSALSDYTRHCHGTLIVDPEEAGAAEVTFGFDVLHTVPLPTYNHAREIAREHLLACIEEHWAARDVPQVPLGCQGLFTTAFPGYPFRHLLADLTDALCAANPEALMLDADVRLQIRGDTGCVRGGSTGVDPHEEHLIADNFRFRCAGRIGEGSGFESVPAEEIGEGSLFERAEPPPPEPAPGSSFTVLSNVRLPGNDLTIIDVATGDWQACQ